MKTYRCGIVGLTGIAASPVRRDLAGPLTRPMPGSHAAAYEAHPQTEVVAICELREELFAKFREDYGAVWPEACAYTDHREMLAAAELDLLSVVTSDHRHRDIVIDAAAAGVGGIFCEKPLATTVAEARAMIAAVEGAGIPMLVDHTRRWWPLWREAWARIQAGEIGAPQRIVATLGGPRAMLFRNGTHLLDCVCWMADGDPEWVFAELDPGFEDHDVYRGDGGRDPATDPGGSGYVHFDNGVRAFINASKHTPQAFALTVIGETATLQIDDTGASITADRAVRPIRQTDWRMDGILAGVDELIRLVEAGGPPQYPHGTSSPREALKVVRILCGLLESQARGNARVAI